MARGVIPIHLMELSPGSFRTFVVGTSYQLGNLASSGGCSSRALYGSHLTFSSISHYRGYSRRTLPAATKWYYQGTQL